MIISFFCWIYVVFGWDKKLLLIPFFASLQIFSDRHKFDCYFLFPWTWDRIRGNTRHPTIEYINTVQQKLSTHPPLPYLYFIVKQSSATSRDSKTIVSFRAMMFHIFKPTWPLLSDQKEVLGERGGRGLKKLFRLTFAWPYKKKLV